MNGHRQLARIEPIPALRDNYIWWIRGVADSVVIDPGAAAPVLRQLERSKTVLRAIVLTHHHADHTGGVAQLVQETGAMVYGPRNESIAGVDRLLSAGDWVSFPELNLRLHVWDVPGHTLGHIAYTGQLHSGQPILFCGDTLFSCGCGRLFEGTPAQLHAALQTYATFDPRTLAYGTHEYTLDNIAFALVVEPDNTELHRWARQAQALRDAGQPTLPRTLAQECAVNPFLRCHIEQVRHNVARHIGSAPEALSELGVFTALRAWKDRFTPPGKLQ